MKQPNSMEINDSDMFLLALSEKHIAAEQCFVARRSGFMDCENKQLRSLYQRL